VIDGSALQLFFVVLTSWLERRERDALAYLIAENRLLRRQLGTRRLRLTDADRRRLAMRAVRVGRQQLHEIASIATPDTLLPGIASSWRGNGRTEPREDVERCSPRSSAWSYGWPKKIRRGVTPGFKGPYRMSGIASDAPRLRES